MVFHVIKAGYFNWRWVRGNLLFINNYQSGGTEGYPMHLWSVSCEFQFYVPTPALFWLAARLNKWVPRLSLLNAVICLCALLWLACTGLRLGWWLASARSNGA